MLVFDDFCYRITAYKGLQNAATARTPQKCALKCDDQFTNSVTLLILNMTFILQPEAFWAPIKL